LIIRKLHCTVLSVYIKSSTHLKQVGKNEEPFSGVPC